MKRNLIAASGLGAGIVVYGSPAHADTGVSEIVNGLSTSPVFVAQGGTALNTKELNSAFSGKKVAVVSIEADSPYGADQMAQMVRADGGINYNAVIVVKGNQFGASLSGDQIAVLTAINSNYKGDPTAAIVAAKSEIVSATTVSEVGTAANGEEGGMGVVGVGGIALAVAVIGTGAALGYKKFMNREKPIVSDTVMDDIPKELRDSIRKLQNLLRQYQERGDVSMVENLRSILNHANQLFIRLKKKGTPASFNAHAIKCSDTFEKLSLALGPDYYMDILDNQHFWDNSKELILQVRDAVKTTDEELVRNIRQVNKNEDLEFRVTLTQLTKSMNDVPSIQEIMKN